MEYLEKQGQPQPLKVPVVFLPFFKEHPEFVCMHTVQGHSQYSRVPLMWTPKGRAKSVHISEPSTVVDALSCGHLVLRII